MKDVARPEATLNTILVETLCGSLGYNLKPYFWYYPPVVSFSLSRFGDPLAFAGLKVIAIT
jgi:hypothetical protein